MQLGLVIGSDCVHVSCGRFHRSRCGSGPNMPFVAAPDAEQRLHIHLDIWVQARRTCAPSCNTCWCLRFTLWCCAERQFRITVRAVRATNMLMLTSMLYVLCHGNSCAAWPGEPFLRQQSAGAPLKRGRGFGNHNSNLTMLQGTHVVDTTEACWFFACLEVWATLLYRCYHA